MLHLGAQEVCKLGKADASVAIRVDSANDCEDFGVGHVGAHLAEEVAQNNLVDLAFIILVDRPVGSMWSVVWAVSQVPNEVFHPVDQIEFVLDDVLEPTLNLVVKRIEAAHSSVRASLSLHAESVVVAGKNKLDEV